MVSYDQLRSYLASRLYASSCSFGHVRFFPAVEVRPNISYALNGDHDHRLQAELLFAVSEQIFEAGAQQLHYHDVVITLNDGPFEVWDSFPLEQL